MDTLTDHAQNGKKAPPVMHESAFINGIDRKVEENPTPAPEDPDSTLQKYAYLRIDDKTLIEEPEPLITISGETVATQGNTVTVSGPTKQGKSAVGSVILTGAITCLAYDGFDGLEVKRNIQRHAVLHFDTEQSRYKHYQNVQAIKRRAYIQALPDHFMSYNLRQLELAKYEQTTREIFEAAYFKHGGIHLALIDGIADYIVDPNDQITSNAIIKFFDKLSVEFNTCILFIVHVNPNSDKERGHLGSQLQRKSESVISIKKDETEGISFIEPKFMRNAGNADIEVIQFKYDKEKGYHVYCGNRNAEGETDKDRVRIQKIKETAKQVFGLDALDFSEAKDKIMVCTSKGDRTAREFFKEMNAHSFILQGEDKRWRLDVQKYT